MATCAACNTIPPVVAEGYNHKGSYVELAGLNTYVTGSQTSTKAVVDIVDIFGLSPQTLQGADLLAAALDALVVVPDFFRGEPAQGIWFSGGEENDKKKSAFMAKHLSNFDGSVKELLAVVEEGKNKWSSIEAWGANGLCWGGKVTALASGENTPFKVTGQVHPGLLNKADAEKIAIPHIVLASKDENAAVVREYEEVFSQPGKVGEIETYGTMHHGWMGGRADLKNADNLKEYERGYNQLVKFFSKYL